jgi:hypothetical protein
MRYSSVHEETTLHFHQCLHSEMSYHLRSASYSSVGLMKLLALCCPATLTESCLERNHCYLVSLEASLRSYSQ